MEKELTKEELKQSARELWKEIAEKDNTELKKMLSEAWESSIPKREVRKAFPKSDVCLSLREGKKYERDRLARILTGMFDIKTICGKKEEVMWYFNNDKGIYIPKAYLLCRRYAEYCFKENCTQQAVNEVIAKVKRLTQIEEKPKPPLDLVCLDNGIYNLKTKNFIPHSSEYFFTKKLPVTFVRDAKLSENIEKFLKETLYEKDIPLFQELLGFFLYRKYWLKRAFIFLGDKDTGKTTTIKLILKLLGEDNVSSVSLQKIVSDRFSSIEFYEKIGNIYDDLSFKDINDNGLFKIATGGGLLAGEYKFGDRFNFYNYAKLLFATNKIPPVKDNNDEAYYDRWIILAFDNIINKKEINPSLIDELATSEGLSGLFNWALEGFYRLVKQKQFSEYMEWRQKKAIMERSASPIASFTQDCLEKGDKEISHEDLHNLFTEYCDLNKLQPITKERLGRQLQNYASWIGNKTGNVRKWTNLQFKSTMDNTLYTKYTIFLLSVVNKNKDNQIMLNDN